MSKVYEFLDEHKMLASSFDQEMIEAAFIKDMKERRSLGMFKTFQRSSLDPE